MASLVIKGNETKPEFGGGLCEIGTTTFRGAKLRFGYNDAPESSYRVRYYEPAGTDATIYDPMPDFRFITTRAITFDKYTIKGDNLIFEVWGTKDGRTVDPIKSAFTTCRRASHGNLLKRWNCRREEEVHRDGACRYRCGDLRIILLMRTVRSTMKFFKSHYRPWQAVCLIEVETLSNTQASSTTEVTPLAP